MEMINKVLLLMCVLLQSFVKMIPCSIESTAFTNNIKSAYSFPCGTPQKRAVTAQSLLGDVMTTSETALPASTPLHRCQDSGCCFNPGETCQPVAFEQVELWFKVRDIIHLTTRFQAILTENHTACGCFRTFDEF